MSKFRVYYILFFFLLMNCSDSEKSSFEVFYKACLGRAGACPGGSTTTHQITQDTGTLTCRIMRRENYYYLTFNVYDQKEGGSISATELEFEFTQGVQTTVTSCIEGGIKFEEGGNSYETNKCTIGDPASGECKVELNIYRDQNLGEVVEGRFYCNEIPINGAGDIYLTTTGDPGSFTFINSCRLPEGMLK